MQIHKSACNRAKSVSGCNYAAAVVNYVGLVMVLLVLILLRIQTWTIIRAIICAPSIRTGNRTDRRKVSTTKPNAPNQNLCCKRAAQFCQELPTIMLINDDNNAPFWDSPNTFRQSSHRRSKNEGAAVPWPLASINE